MKKITRNDLTFMLCIFLAVVVILLIIRNESTRNNKNATIERYKRDLLTQQYYNRWLKAKVSDIQTLYKPTKENAKFWIKYYEIKAPAVVFWQLERESNMCSKVFRECRNLFGVHYVPGRRSTAIGQHGVYAVYPDYVQSIADYKLLQDRWHVPDGISNKGYLRIIKKVNFSTDTTYFDDFVNKKRK